MTAAPARIYVMDASAMLALGKGEPGGDVVEAILNDPRNVSYAHGMNLCEVFYIVRRDRGDTGAREVLQDLHSLGVTAREDLDAAFRLEVGRLKADYAVALPDCCGLALALRVGGTFVTADHKELDPVDAAGVCPIRFIR
ncbi:MAG: PIN domain-containing protein [Armatimonadetes bacterium]|nr:PIN domain-containing protein [Armatimonadota bacterium]